MNVRPSHPSSSMRKHITVRGSAAALLFAASAASAATAQQPPAVRPLGSVVATSAETFGSVVSVRHLPAGVLVNDVQNRRLLLLDSTLSTMNVVADTTPATANAYSGRAAGLVAYRGDSSLFIDAASLSMLVIDPAGQVARVMSVPRSQDAMVLGNPALGTPALDAAGRLVYRGMPRPMMRPPGAGGAGGALGAGGGGGLRIPTEPPDSVALVRVDLTSRQVDTVAFTKVPKAKVDVQRDENGNMSVSVQMNPLPVVDDWAVMADGSIAILRGRDYHVDWVRPDGVRESSPKLPFEWQRLTDEDKVAFMDSLKAARERMGANAQTPTMADGAAMGGAAPGGGAGGGEQRIVIIGPGGGAAGGRGPGGGRSSQVNFVAPSDLPDYKPAFFANSARADRDGHLWIRTIPTVAVPGGPVYDVVNLKGELVERVQLPPERTIVGFGEGGVVYLLAREGATSKLERARAR